MIEPLYTDPTTPDSAPTRKRIWAKVNELIEAHNAVHAVKKEVVVSEPVKPVEPEPIAVLSFDGYTPVGGSVDARFFMPPPGIGHVDTDGTVIQGMISRDSLPVHVLQHFNQHQSNG